MDSTTRFSLGCLSPLLLSSLLAVEHVEEDGKPMLYLVRVGPDQAERGWWELWTDGSLCALAPRCSSTWTQT